MKTRYAEKRVQRFGHTTIVSGFVPAGLEYFHSTYNDRPVEYSLYKDEEGNHSENVTITYLDVGEDGPVEIGEAPLLDLEWDVEPADWFTTEFVKSFK